MYIHMYIYIYTYSRHRDKYMCVCVFVWKARMHYPVMQYHGTAGKLLVCHEPCLSIHPACQNWVRDSAYVEVSKWFLHVLTVASPVKDHSVLGPMYQMDENLHITGQASSQLVGFVHGLGNFHKAAATSRRFCRRKSRYL